MVDLVKVALESVKVDLESVKVESIQAGAAKASLEIEK